MNNKIKAVVFDLDGTLISSHQNIYLATIKTLQKLNINFSFNENIFYSKIGLHFKDIFDDMGIIVNDIEHFINEYKKVYFDYINYSTPYPNVYHTLNNLFNLGIKINLLTTKSQEQAELILNHFNISKFFSFVLGRRPEYKIKPEPDGLFIISKELDINVNNILMVGDTHLDLLCGKNAGSLTCGVTYGYGNADYLKSFNPDYLIDELSLLNDIVANKNLL